MDRLVLSSWLRVGELAPYLALSLALSGCTNLPLIEVNECGNFVTEPAAFEACDGQPGCGGEMSDHPCRYVCSRTTGQDCPKGFGCGVDGVCRRHKGAFAPLQSATTATTTDLGVGDINNDGCYELVRTTLRGHVVMAFQSRADDFCEANLQTLPTERPRAGQASIAPLLADLTADKHLELLVSGDSLLGAGLFVYLASQSTAALSSMLYPNARLMQRAQRALTARMFGSEVALIVVGDDGGSAELMWLPDARQQFKPLGPLGIAPDELLLHALADLDGDQQEESKRCDELIYAVGSAQQLKVAALCQDGKDQLKQLPAVQLDSGAKIRGRASTLATLDYNSDGDIDLLVNADDGKIHIAYGQGDGTFHSSPDPPAVAADQKTSALALDPKIAEELSKPDTLFVAGNFNLDTPEPEIELLSCPPASPFQSPVCSDDSSRSADPPTPGDCQALVVDINDDGKLDIVAAEAEMPDLVVRTGGGDGSFHTTFLTTQCPAEHLTAGDFDGDRITDVAFFDQQALNSDEASTVLRIAYGRAGEAPSRCQNAGARRARRVQRSGSPPQQSRTGRRDHGRRCCRRDHQRSGAVRLRRPAGGATKLQTCQAWRWVGHGLHGRLALARSAWSVLIGSRHRQVPIAVGEQKHRSGSAESCIATTQQAAWC